jgi:hypothetical protein
MVIRNIGNLENKKNMYGALSDERLKENIVDARSYTDDICKLKVKTFNFKERGGKQLGVIAQDVQKIFPSLVSEDPETGNLSVGYSVFNTMLIKYVQEQQEVLNSHQQQITAQQQQIDDLMKLVSKLTK